MLHARPWAWNVAKIDLLIRVLTAQANHQFTSLAILALTSGFNSGMRPNTAGRKPDKYRKGDPQRPDGAMVVLRLRSFICLLKAHDSELNVEHWKQWSSKSHDKNSNELLAKLNTQEQLRKRKHSEGEEKKANIASWFFLETASKCSVIGVLQHNSVGNGYVYVDDSR